MHVSLENRDNATYYEYSKIQTSAGLFLFLDSNRLVEQILFPVFTKFPIMAEHTIILDNGGSSLKFGFASDQDPKLIPNCVTKVKSERLRPFIGDQLEDCKDYSGLFYLLPCQKGYIVNWDIQRQIWDYVLKVKHGIKTFGDYNMVLTEPYMNFKSIQENLLEIFFEEYGFKWVIVF